MEIPSENRWLKMKVLETKIVDIKDINIGRCLIRSIETIKENEDLQNLLNSIDKMGQLHPCFVRQADDKYELVAGGRRYAALSQKENKIEVKVVEATDLESIELGLSENLHRKDPDVNQRDTQIYRAWKLGKRSGQYICISDLAKKIAMSEHKVGEIISWGETREISKYKDNKVIQNATTVELAKTKPLAEYPELREKVLDLAQKKDIAAKDVTEVTKKIKTFMDEGVSKDHAAKAIDLVSPPTDVPKDNTKGDSTKCVSTIVGTSITTLQPNKLADVLDTIKKSPPDIKKKLVEKRITLEHAKIANEFNTEEARNQILKEVKKIEKHKEMSSRIHDNDKDLNIETRKKQQEDMKKTGETKLRTDFDRQLENKLHLEQTYNERHEKAFLERYQKLAMDTTTVLMTFHPRKMKTEEGKKSVLKIIRSIYDLYHDILADTDAVRQIIDVEVKQIIDVGVVKVE
jgi:ParB/RepB/Spo0J family partition protein